METAKQKMNNVFDVMSKSFGYSNKFAAPQFEKIVVSAGTGTKSRFDRKANDLIIDRLSKITGQLPTLKRAKKSVAQFRMREGDPIGVSVTLRGDHMYSFFDKLIHIALPRTRDFRGIPRTSIDEMGNLTIGVREHTIFPETSEDDLRDVFGFAVTIVTTAKTPEEALAFFEHVGVPFQRTS